MADSVSGELVIVPDAEALATITGDTYDWTGAVDFAAAYDDGTNSDYRLITKSEALEILTNNDLLSQLGLTGTENFWTIEEIGLENAYVFAGIPKAVYGDDKVISHLVCPVRKVNFYGLPLIESEFGGGLVYDVVAATRTVHIIPKWADVEAWDNASMINWNTAIGLYPDESIEPLWETLPTRAQAIKIFGNSYLVSLAGLPVDSQYWTIEEHDIDFAYALDPGDNNCVSLFPKTNLNYALPVRSEVVPET